MMNSTRRALLFPLLCSVPATHAFVPVSSAPATTGCLGESNKANEGIGDAAEDVGHAGDVYRVWNTKTNKCGGTSSGETSRRRAFGDVLRLSVATSAAGCACCPRPASALARLVPAAGGRYDPARNPLTDAAFARSMAAGMRDYERAAAPAKRRLFDRLAAALWDVAAPTIVEVGLGAFPNAALYPRTREGLDIVGVDPNDRMEAYARDSAARAGLVPPRDSLRIVHGVSEALPLEDDSCDALVCVSAHSLASSKERRAMWH